MIRLRKGMGFFFPGLQFNALQVVRLALESNLECEVFTGSTVLLKRLQDLSGCTGKFIPIPVRTATRVLKFQQPRLGKYIDAAFFSRFAAFRSQFDQASFSHCWATFALEVFKRFDGNRILDRACPHVLDQQSRLAKYAERHELPFSGHSSWFIERQLEEYDLATTIVVPSRLTADSFAIHGLAEKVVRAPLGPSVSLSMGQIDSKRDSDTSKRRKKDEVVVGVYGGNWRRQGILDLFLALSKCNWKWSLIIRANRSDFADFPWERFSNRFRDRVIFKPYYQSICQFFDDIDILSSVAVESGFGMIAVEAVSYGKVVVLSDSTGACDVIGGHPLCYVVKDLDIGQFRDCLTVASENYHLIPSRELGSNEVVSILANAKAEFANSLCRVWGGGA